jgi:hypothetical protein
LLSTIKLTFKFEIYRPVNTIKFLFLLKLEVVFITNITIPPTSILLVRQRVSDTLLSFCFYKLKLGLVISLFPKHRDIPKWC